MFGPCWPACLSRHTAACPLLVHRRRSKQGSAPLTQEEKLAAWEELKVAAFCRALGAAWLLPLLDLFVRIQLNILGRHLYLESAVESRWGPREHKCGKLVRIAALHMLRSPGYSINLCTTQHPSCCHFHLANGLLALRLLSLTMQRYAAPSGCAQAVGPLPRALPVVR
jgi:hypothetical protein